MDSSIETPDGAIVVVGYGKLPHGTSVEQLHKVLAVVALVDQAGTVLDASSTLLTAVGDRYVCRLLRGRNLRHDPASFVTDITTGYHGHAQKAIIASFRDLVRRYLEVVAAPATSAESDSSSA